MNILKPSILILATITLSPDLVSDEPIPEEIDALIRAEVTVDPLDEENAGDARRLGFLADGQSPPAGLIILGRFRLRGFAQIQSALAHHIFVDFTTKRPLMNLVVL